MKSLDAFCVWLAATAPSQWLQRVEWVIPTVQSVHILCVAAVLTASLMIDLRLLGARSAQEPIGTVIRRFAPFVWWPLPILLASGGVLILAEPARALENPVFALKMALLALAAGATLAASRPLRIDPAYWDRPGERRGRARLLGALTLPLWAGIVFAGRWIAYVQG